MTEDKLSPMHQELFKELNVQLAGEIEERQNLQNYLKWSKAYIYELEERVREIYKHAPAR